MATVDETRREFGERGFVVMPTAVSDALVEAANERADQIIAESPPPDGTRGQFVYPLQLLGADPLLATVIESFAFPVAESMVYPRDIFYPTRCQLTLSLPQNNATPTGPQLDGLDPLEADGRPGTYSMLVGVFLTNLDKPDLGNPIVWPGTHVSAGAYLAEHGAETLAASKPYPPVTLPAPEPVLGRAGDLLIAHYLLGRAPGPNTSATQGRVVYFRLSCDKHKRVWQQAVTDPFFEFEPVRKAMQA